VGKSFLNKKTFCREVLSFLPLFYDIWSAYFLNGSVTNQSKDFDYAILLVKNTLQPFSFPLYPIEDKDLTLLECLLLKQIIKEIKTHSSVILGIRFGPKLIKETKGKAFFSLEVLSSKDKVFFRDLISNISSLSSEPPFFGLSSTRVKLKLTMLPEFLRKFLKICQQGKAIDDKLIDFLNEALLSVICEIGIGRLLTIPELVSREKVKELPLTGEDFSTIDLMQKLVKPLYSIRPKITPNLIEISWAKLPSRLFIYGPVLHLVNLIISKKILKLCENCGSLYRPYPYQEERQRYCSKKCQRRAQSKRHYQRKKQNLKYQNNL